MMPEGDDWPGLARQWAFAHFEMRKRWLDHLSEQLGPSAPLVRVAARDEHAAECRFRQEQGESGRLRELDEAVMGATPLRRLASLYGLVDRDLRLLLLMAVVAEDARLRRVASTMTEAVPGLEEMLRIVAATGGAETRHGALELWGFLDETPTGATVPSWCRAWTLGVNVVEPLARALLHPLERRPALSTWPVKALTQQIEAVLRQGRPVRVVIRGQARSGRATFAAEVAHTLGLRSAEVTGFPSPNEARAIVRQCMWSDMAPVLRDEAWLDLARRCLPPLQFVTQRPDAACSSQPHAVDVHVALPPAPREELLDLWKASVAELPWRERVLEALAWRQDLSPSDPDRVARSCPPDAASAMALLDADRRDRLTGLATKLTTPFSMEDLVVGNPTREELERLIHEAKARLTIGRKPEVARLMGGETGLVALFHGPPGTGKTMAARVVGQTLGFDVYLVDMSSLVSKWVGETMKHTAAILEAAQSLDVVLFFDEADA
ncbi:MAG: AAA family ATPase, partial [Myxococcales bacterium]|nr:AAA family ATPase [Myxococcales bacterium]